MRGSSPQESVSSRRLSESDQYMSSRASGQPSTPTSSIHHPQPTRYERPPVLDLRSSNTDGSSMVAQRGSLKQLSPFPMAISAGRRSSADADVTQGQRFQPDMFGEHGYYVQYPPSSLPETEDTEEAQSDLPKRHKGFDTARIQRPESDTDSVTDYRGTVLPMHRSLPPAPDVDQLLEVLRELATPEIEPGGPAARLFSDTRLLNISETGKIASDLTEPSSQLRIAPISSPVSTVQGNLPDPSQFAQPTRGGTSAHTQSENGDRLIKDHQFRPPRLFVGRFAGRSAPKPLRSRWTKQRKSGRLDIRAMPNYDGDSIDGGSS